MTSIVVGTAVVVGACIALWWHNRRYQSLEADAGDDHQASDFARRQYNRRTLTTTLIGVVGLAIMGLEIFESKWADLISFSVLTVVMLILPFMAMFDFIATQRYFRQNDQGVKQASRNLADELRKVEAKLREAKLKDGSEEGPGESSEGPSTESTD